MLNECGVTQHYRCRVDPAAAKGGDVLYEPSKIGCQFRGQALERSRLTESKLHRGTEYLNWFNEPGLCSDRCKKVCVSRGGMRSKEWLMTSISCANT